MAIACSDAVCSCECKALIPLYWSTKVQQMHYSHQTVSLAQVVILGMFSHIAMSSLVWHTEFIPALSNKLWRQLAQLANV